MPDSFNENLAAFLTTCRESALRELAQSSSEYKTLVANVAEISKNATNKIPCEYAPLVDDLTDSMYALARMEMNYLYLRGYKDCVNLSKRFDTSFIESEEFEKFYT